MNYLKTLKTIVILLVPIISLVGQSNKYLFERITITDGLPQSTVYSIIQDSKGYIWFGTQDKGLCKYDGYSFKVYNYDPFAENCISSNKISHILEDSDGNIWIGTWGGGLNKLDPKTEKFIAYQNDPNDPKSIANNKAQILFYDLEGTLWVGTAGGGLSKFNAETETFENYRNSVSNLNSISNDRLWSIAQQENGIMWIGTDYGLNRFEPKKGLFETFFHNPENKYSISHNQVRQVYIDKQGTLWLGTAVGLDKYDETENKFIHFNCNDTETNRNSINKIYEDKLGNFWLGTHIGGMKLFNRENGSFTSFINNPENDKTISYDDVREIILDNTNILWITTRGGGLNKLDLKPPKFEYYAHEPGNTNSLLNNRVKSIYEDKEGILWIGTDIGGGLNKYDRKSSKYTHYKHQPGKPNSLISNDITAIAEDKNGNLWLGTDGFGLNVFNPTKETFKLFKNDPNNPNSLCFNEIFDIQEDAYGYIWIGTNNGLDKYDPIKDIFYHYTEDKNDTNSISDNQIWVIYTDSQDRIWIGTDNGLNMYNEKYDNFSVFQFDPENENGLINSTIYSIFEDTNKTIWLGTEFGLHKLNADNSSFTFIPEKEGISINAIFGILADNNNNLWYSTVNGITQYNVSQNTFRYYDIYDGLQNNDYHIGACYKSTTGELIFGGVNGFNIFDPEKVLDNPTKPNIVITDFKLFNKSLTTKSKKLEKSIDYTEEIKLKYNENFFSIGFAALNFTKNEKNQYKCILEGFDEEWIDLETRRYNHYTNIPHGEYTFKVIGSNNDNLWNEQSTDLKIIITPPFWKTIWFIIIEGVVVILIILAIIRLRERSLILSKKELENIVRERTMELSDQKEELESALALISKQKDGLKEANIKIQESTKIKEEFLAKTSHELRTPLNVIVGFANLMLNEELSEKQKSYLREIKTSTDNLLLVINDILTFSKIESGKLKIEVIEFEFEKTISTVFKSFTLKAEEKGIKFTKQIDNTIPDYIFGAPVRLNQVLSNLIDNAIKFTEKPGSVKLEINKVKQQNNFIDIEFIIEDSGIGMDLNTYENIYESFTQASNDTTRKYGGTGLGLSIVKRLVELMEGKIEVESKLNKGTKFTVLLTFEIGAGNNVETNVTDYHIDKSIIDGEIRVLLVEDNPINTILAVDTIRLYNPNFIIENAENGKVAIEKLKEADYDLMILDIQMPVMDGYETTKIIRNEFDPPKKDIPILGMSAHAMKEEKDKCFALGMNDYITKPFVPDDLFKKIETIISNISAYRSRDKQESLANKYKYLNLQNLVAIYGENQEKIDSIINICLDNIPKELIDLRNYIENKDFNNIKVTSHSIKTTLTYLGIEELKELAQEIENLAANNEKIEEIKNKFEKIQNTWGSIELELKDYISEK